MDHKTNLSVNLLNKSSARPVSLLLCLLLASVFLLSACFGGEGGDDVQSSDAEPTAIVQENNSAAASAAAVVPNQPANVSTIPVAMSIPEIGFDASVAEMGWIVTEVAGERTTRWEIPYSAAGWHVNSAGVGTRGNMVISGHQVVGEAIFAPLALGEVTVGQEILVTDIRGEVFRYDVTEVTEPIPLTGATADDEALAASYVAPSSQAKLTLMTGWPDFATTHYLFVVADFAGAVE